MTPVHLQDRTVGTPGRLAACMARILLAAGLLASCSRGGDPSAERARRAAEGEGPILIGAPWPWEIRQTILYRLGMDLALDEINKAGGVHGRSLQLLRVDDQEDVDRGRLVAQQLSGNPDVVAVIGHLQSYVTVPAAAAYDLSGLVLVAPTATSPELTRRGYNRVFRATFSDVDVGRAMADYALDHGYRRIAIYYSRDEYGRGLANAFEERAASGHAQILNRRSYDLGGPGDSLTAAGAADSWRHIGADAVFIAGEGESAATLAIALRRRGIDVPLLGGDALAIPAFLELGGQAVEGAVIASRFSSDAPTSQVQGFTAAFRTRFGRDPDAGAALGYDALRLLAYAMSQANSVAPDRVAAALHAVRGWPGVTGAITFDSAGNLVDMRLPKVIVHDGAFRYLSEPPTPAPLAGSSKAP